EHARDVDHSMKPPRGQSRSDLPWRASRSSPLKTALKLAREGCRSSRAGPSGVPPPFRDAAARSRPTAGTIHGGTDEKYPLPHCRNPRSILGLVVDGCRCCGPLETSTADFAPGSEGHGHRGLSSDQGVGEAWTPVVLRSEDDARRPCELRDLPSAWTVRHRRAADIDWREAAAPSS